MNLEKKDLLRFALAVIVTTTLIVSCFPLFQITSNWAANVQMFVPGLVAALPNQLRWSRPRGQGRAATRYSVQKATW
jgi:hypothetical protein